MIVCRAEVQMQDINEIDNILVNFNFDIRGVCRLTIL